MKSAISRDEIPHKGSGVIGREIRMMKESQEVVLEKHAVLETNQRRGKAIEDQSDQEEEEESENENPQRGV